MLRQAASCIFRILPYSDLPSDGDHHHAQGDVPVAVVHHLHELDVGTRSRHPRHEVIAKDLVQELSRLKKGEYKSKCLVYYRVSQNFFPMFKRL